MDSHCINIAVSGLSLKVSDELKILIRNLISNQYGINWVNISNNNIPAANRNFVTATNQLSNAQRALKNQANIARNLGMKGYANRLNRAANLAGNGDALKALKSLKNTAKSLGQ